MNLMQYFSYYRYKLFPFSSGLLGVELQSHLHGENMGQLFGLPAYQYGECQW